MSKGNFVEAIIEIGKIPLYELQHDLDDRFNKILRKYNITRGIFDSIRGNHYNPLFYLRISDEERKKLVEEAKKRGIIITELPGLLQPELEFYCDQNANRRLRISFSNGLETYLHDLIYENGEPTPLAYLLDDIIF